VARFEKSEHLWKRVNRTGIKISLKERDKWDVPKRDCSTGNWKASGTNTKEIGNSFVSLHTKKLLEEEEILKEGKT
jgi:hypothetical protein